MSKPPYIVLNGNYLLENEPVLKANNRAFCYGDGVFETLRSINGKVLDFDIHFARLVKGLETLKIEVPSYFNKERLLGHFEQLAEKNGIEKGGRFRLSVFRNNGGYYTPVDSELSYLISASTVDNNLYQLNETGIAVDTYLELRKPKNILSPYKLINAQLSVLASIDAQKRKLGEALLLNEEGYIIEGASSNLFTVNEGVLYTPAISDGCLAGITRMHIINIAIQSGMKVYEGGLTPQRLLEADEVFLTNSVNGIKWVGRFRTKRYYHKVANTLLAKLNEKMLNSTRGLQGN